MKPLKLIPFDDAIDLRPTQTRMVTAQYDEEGIIVYQAYNDAIADYVLEHKQFGGDFKLGRMTWIKPNFLWMMHRSDWAKSKNQERILAIKISHTFFLSLLEQAVLTSYFSAVYPTQEAWKAALESSEVRVQWDPYYNLYDQKQQFKAIQIGLKSNMAIQYAQQKILQVQDVTDYAQQLHSLLLNNQRSAIELPEENHYQLPGHLYHHLLIG